jgi:hypothetical protein
MTQENEPKVENTPEIADAAEVAAASGPIGGTVTTYPDLEDCLPNPGEGE